MKHIHLADEERPDGVWTRCGGKRVDPSWCTRDLRSVTCGICRQIVHRTLRRNPGLEQDYPGLGAAVARWFPRETSNFGQLLQLRRHP